MDDLALYIITGHHYRECPHCNRPRRTPYFRYRLRWADSEQTQQKLCRDCGLIGHSWEKEYNREWDRAYWHTQRARAGGGGGFYTIYQWKELCGFYEHHCLYCRKQLPLTVDHVIPVSKGGSNDISNLQPLCARCNSVKSVHQIDFRPFYKRGEAWKRFRKEKA